MHNFFFIKQYFSINKKLISLKEKKKCKYAYKKKKKKIIFNQIKLDNKNKFVFYFK
jgi:hypothetical protein